MFGPARSVVPGASPSSVADHGALRRSGELVAGRYRLDSVIGRGGTAEVWCARDELLERSVAVKCFHSQAADPLTEARMAAVVQHPNVVVVHDLVRHVGSWCLVTDHFPRGDLASAIRCRGALPPPVVCAIGLGLLAALRAVHEAGLVHCDVKPANVLLGDAGEFVLADFGIAERVGQEPVHPERRDGLVLGSPAYMAPEVLRGGRPTPASDLWSLGVTLYTAVEGHPPYAEGDPVETALAVLHDPPPRAGRASGLRPLLDRLLVKQPRWRPSHEAVHALLIDAAPTTGDPIVAGSAAETPPAELATASLATAPDRRCG